jgi:drug/metabolite transporter (DMT)-like permease
MAAWHAQFVALAAIWGSSFLCIKVLGEDWPATHVALGRVGLGALVLLLIVALRRIPLPRDPRTWGHLAVAGLLMNAAPFTLFAYGEQTVSSIAGGLWNATVPLTALVFVLLLLPDERPDRRRLTGLAIGFAGVVVLLGPWQTEGGALLGHLACLAAACCYGLGAPWTRRHLAHRPESGVALAAAQLLLATGMLALVAPLEGAPNGTDAAGVASLLVLGVLGSGVAYVLTYAIVRAAGATTFSTVAYLIPLFSTALGVLLLGEGLRPNEPVGALVVLLGIAVSSGVVGPQARQQPRHEEAPRDADHAARHHARPQAQRRGHRARAHAAEGRA